MPPTSSTNNNSNNEALVAIQVTLATHGEMFKNLKDSIDDVKSTVDKTDARVEKLESRFDRYMPVQEANTRFENLQASITSILARLTEIELWRLQFLVNNVKDIANVQQESKHDVHEAKEASLLRLISQQGAVLLIVASLVVYAIEQFISNAHLFGR